MTSQPVAALPADPIEAFKRTCRQTGLKVTHQRLEILGEITAARDHPSAEEMHQRLRERMPTLSLDTVYRTLATLEQHGIITKLSGADGRGRFDGNPAPHHHLVCSACGRIQDFSWPAFDSLRPPPPTAEWGDVRARQVEFRGTCPACRKRGHRRSVVKR